MEAETIKPRMRRGINRKRETFPLELTGCSGRRRLCVHLLECNQYFQAFKKVKQGYPME